MSHISKRAFIAIALMLFSMFFGAGNFIFPPFLGSQAGSSTHIAIFAFCLTAVLFPVLGIAAFAKANGLYNLASRVSHRFAIIHSVALLLIIGPLFAIPRAGNMPFELTIKPFLETDLQISWMPLFIYSIVYFIINYFLCQNLTRIIEALGKILTPLLLILITVLFIAAFINPMHEGAVLEPIAGYETAPIIKGVLEGYQTMDALASLSFGLVVLLAFRKIGVEDERSVVKYTIGAGVLAGIILAAIYLMLAYVGMHSFGLFKFSGNLDEMIKVFENGTKLYILEGSNPHLLALYNMPDVLNNAELLKSELAAVYQSGATIFMAPQNGAEILVNVTNHLFGSFGNIVLGTTIGLACLTTTVGLISAASEYFASLTSIKYRSWVIIWCVISSIIANAGLTQIIQYGVPILGVIYPISLVFIVLSLVNGIIKSDKVIYNVTAYVTLIISVIHTLQYSFGLKIPLIADLFAFLPFYSGGLGWVIPALIAMVVCYIFRKSKLDPTITH